MPPESTAVKTDIDEAKDGRYKIIPSPMERTVTKITLKVMFETSLAVGFPKEIEEVRIPTTGSLLNAIGPVVSFCELHCIVKYLEPSWTIAAGYGSPKIDFSVQFSEVIPESHCKPLATLTRNVPVEASK